MRASVVVLVGSALVLAGCASTGQSAGPNWKPKPSFSGEGYEPPGNAQPAQPRVPGGQPTQVPSSSGGKQNGDGAVVAKRLTAPTGIAILPDNTALVAERTTGRIVRVQPTPGHPAPTVRIIRGLSSIGGGGLLDLALSPNYSQDNLIFAYLTTRKDNRVVAFTLNGPMTPVLTGIPRGRTGNSGRIAFAADGNLLVGTGDAGRPALARDPHSLAGKVLRITDIGAPAAGNPVKGSRVFASGFTGTDGLCTASDSTLALQTESEPNAPSDPLFRLASGRRYGLSAGETAPIATLPAGDRAPGGCAIMNNVLFATSLDGRALLAAQLSVGGTRVAVGAFHAGLRNKYGRLRTVVAAPDGALWLTTSNKDGKGHPVPADERVLRIIPSGGASDNPL